MQIKDLLIKGQGQPFVWLHGMLNSVEVDSMYSLVDFNTVSEIAKVVRYDACRKSIAGDYRWDAMTDQLNQVLDNLGNVPVVVGGASMGSVTSLHFAVKYPEKVKALILVTPPPAWENRLAVRALYRKIASKAKDDCIPEFLRRLISLTQDPPDFYEHEHPGTRERLISCRLEFEPAYYSQIYLGGAASDLPSRKQIAEIQVPTLIIATPDDENHPLDSAKELNGLINSSKLIVVSDYKGYRDLQTQIKDFINLTVGDNLK